MRGEEHGEPPTQNPGETRAGSGWVTTKQAAKALGVSRRSVQGYVKRGMLEAREEGEGVNKTFYVSIDSLNALRDRRNRARGSSGGSADPSSDIEETANPSPNIGEALRHAIERVEARTEEAAELRVRLELTARAESTLREELEEAHRRRERAERERDELAARLAALEEARESPQTAAEGSGGVEERPFTEEAQEGAEASRGGRMRATTFAVLLAILGVLVGLAAAVIGRFYL